MPTAEHITLPTSSRPPTFGRLPAHAGRAEQVAHLAETARDLAKGS